MYTAQTRQAIKALVLKCHCCLETGNRDGYREYKYHLNKLWRSRHAKQTTTN